MPDNSPVLLSIIAVVAIVGVVGIVGTIGLVGMKTASSATTPTGLTTFQFGCYQTTPATTLVNISKLPIGFKGNQTVAVKRHAGWQKMPDTACSNRITSTGKSAWQALPQQNVFIPLLNNQCFVVDVFANPEDKVNLIVPIQPCPTAPPGGVLFSDNFDDGVADGWLTGPSVFPRETNEWAVISGKYCSLGGHGASARTEMFTGASITGTVDISKDKAGVYLLSPRISEPSIESPTLKGNAVFWDLNPFDNSIVLFGIQFDNPSSTFVWGPVVFIPNIPNKVGLSVTSNTLSILADNVVVGSVPLSVPLSQGTIIISNIDGNAGPCFDNVLLTSP